MLIKRSVASWDENGLHKATTALYYVFLGSSTKTRLDRTKAIYICYLPSGRSVLGKTVSKVLSTARGCTNTDRPTTANNVFIFFFGTALKATFVLNFLLKKFSSNLAYVRTFMKNQKCLFLLTLIIGIHNCLTLSKKFTFYIVYNTFTLLQKFETFLQLEILERSVTLGLDGKIRTAGACTISQ